MTVPCLTQDELLNLIKGNGWEIASTDYWEEYDRLVLEKNDSIFIFQCKQKHKYFFLEVVKTCQLMKIPPPEDHIHSYYLYKKKYEDECYCESKKKFKDCHGKDSIPA